MRLPPRPALLPLLASLTLAACGQDAGPPPEPAFPTRKSAPASAPKTASTAELVTPAELVASPAESAPVEVVAPVASEPSEPGAASGAARAQRGPAGSSTMNNVPVGVDRPQSQQGQQSQANRGRVVPGDQVPPAAPNRHHQERFESRDRGQRNAPDGSPPPEDPPPGEGAPPRRH